METYELDHGLFARQFAGDEKLFVQFRMDILKNEAKTLENGRPIFDDVEWVKIMAPGDRLNIIDRPACEEDRIRFARPYQAFKEKKVEHGGGTPLAEWPVVTRSQAEELKYFGFHTVEHIANATDNAAVNVPAFHQLKARAQAFLDLAKNSTAPLEKLQGDLETEKAKNAQLADAILELQKQVRLMSNPKTSAAQAADDDEK